MWNKLIEPTAHWQRAIILVDMNAFFASIEQLDSPSLRGRAVAVTNGKEGTCIITSSSALIKIEPFLLTKFEPCSAH